MVSAVVLQKKRRNEPIFFGIEMPSDAGTVYGDKGENS